MRLLAFALLLLAGCTDPVPGWDTRIAGGLPGADSPAEVGAMLDCIYAPFASPQVRHLLDEQVVTFTPSVWDGFRGKNMAGLWNELRDIRVATSGAQSIGDTALAHELTRVVHYAITGRSLSSTDHARTYVEIIDHCNREARQ